MTWLKRCFMLWCWKLNCKFAWIFSIKFAYTGKSEWMFTEVVFALCFLCVIMTFLVRRQFLPVAEIKTIQRNVIFSTGEDMFPPGVFGWLNLHIVHGSGVRCITWKYRLYKNLMSCWMGSVFFFHCKCSWINRSQINTMLLLQSLSEDVKMSVYKEGSATLNK